MGSLVHGYLTYAKITYTKDFESKGKEKYLVNLGHIVGIVGLLVADYLSLYGDYRFKVFVGLGTGVFGFQGFLLVRALLSEGKKEEPVQGEDVDGEVDGTEVTLNSGSKTPQSVSSAPQRHTASPLRRRKNIAVHQQ